MKLKMLVKKTYKSGAALAHGRTPVCRHQAEGFDVDGAWLLAAGRLLVDGQEREYHDIRVFFKERNDE